MDKNIGILNMIDIHYTEIDRKIDIFIGEQIDGKVGEGQKDR